MHGAPEHPADLRKHTIIAATATVPRNEFKSGLCDGGSSEKTRMRLTVTSHDAAVDAALAGLGITWLLFPHVAPLLHDGRLVTVWPGHDPAPLPVQVVHREGKHGVSKVRDFIDLLVARLRANSSLH
jgi:DNA-binding transcriptional LysR family regulator